jgi:hypothetical protein
MDSVTKSIRQGIHGEPTGVGGPDVYCDVDETHEERRAVDPTRRIQFECIRVVDVPEIELYTTPPDRWVPDLLRCGECSRSDLGRTTEGYDEALVELAITDSGQGYVLDATELRLLDYSPATDGVRPPPLPLRFIVKRLGEGDFGVHRASRVERAADQSRRRGHHDLADQFRCCLEAAVATGTNTGTK